MFELIPVNYNIKQRETNWICVCPDCQHERIITYAQKWNISTGKSHKECKSCLRNKGFYSNKIGLEQGRKSIKNRIGTKRPKNKDYIKYRQLFAPETLSNPEMKQKQRLARLGKFKGENHPNWQGGKTSERIRLMSSDEYKQLKKQVLKRDKYTCQICSQYGGKLEMDHIKEWCNYLELRFEITNCRILCKNCHKKTDNYGNKAKILKEKNRGL